MERNLYLVVGTPLSDIGKGWLAGSIASALSSAHLIKIDPVLNPVDFEVNDLTKGMSKMTDAQTYDELGIAFDAEQLFLQGNFLLDFLEAHKAQEVSTHTTPRLTFSDVAQYLAQKVCDVFVQSKKADLVIEVGGTVTDPELSYIPSAIRLVAARLRANLRIVVLSYLDYSEDQNLSSPIKTRNITYGIEQTRRIYGEPSLVFFRRRNLSRAIENNIKAIVDTISIRGLFPKERVIYLPNFASPTAEREFIRNFLGICS